MSKDSRLRVPGSPGSSTVRALVASAFALSLASSPATAALWRASGMAVDSAATVQSGIRVVTDGNKGFIAAWLDSLSGQPNVRCQRVDSTGALRWAAGGVLVRANAFGLADLAAASDGAGGILLAWTDRAAVTQSRIRLQRLNASGVAQWAADGVFADPAAADTTQSAPSLDSDGSGGAIVAWADGRTAPNEEIYVQRVDSGGSPAWTAGGVLTRSDGGNDNQASARVLGDGLGGAWVSWDDLGNVSATDARTFLQRFDGAGAPLWTIDGVTPGSEVLNGRMARVAGSDSLMFVWSETTPDRLFGSRVSPASGVFATPTGLQQISSTGLLPVGVVTQAGGGSLVVVANSTQIQAIALSVTGVPQGSTVTLGPSETLVASSNVTVVPDGANGLYAVWASNGSVYARHLTSAGAADWGAPVALTSGVTPSQTWPVAVGGGDLLAAWVDGRNAGTRDDLYAQRVSPSGVTGSYYRILRTTASGTGTFNPTADRTWVRERDSLSVSFTGTGGNRIDHVVVGATNLGPVPNYEFHDVKGDSTIQVFFSTTPATQQLAAVANSYRAFSVPFTFANNAVTSVFANLGAYDNTRWRLGHWEADDNAYLEPSGALTTIVPGAGYWFIGLKDTTLSFSGTPVTEAQFSLTMLGAAGSTRGWTQFGSPFRFPLAVSQLRLSQGPDVPISDPANNLTDPQVLEWNPSTSQYGAVSVLLPGRAYWLWRDSTAGALQLRFPFAWDPVAVAAPAPSPSAGASWAVGLSARSGAHAARLEFGAAPVAAGRRNALSGHALPAGPGNELSLVARVTDWGSDNGEYRAVFRPDAQSLAWEFDASVPGALSEATLSFEFDRLPADRRVVLSEPATGWSREVAHGAGVSLVLSASARRLRLEVLANGPVTPPAPLATMLRALGPNPFRDATTLSFSLGQAGPLRWEVFDLAGRRVAAATRTLEAGEHLVTWDGRDDAGQRVSPGLYLLRWQAAGRSGTARLVHTD